MGRVAPAPGQPAEPAVELVEALAALGPLVEADAVSAGLAIEVAWRRPGFFHVAPRAAGPVGESHSPRTWTPASLLACARDGYWFCRGCEHVVETEGELYQRCGRCGSRRVEYHGPCLT